MDRICPYNYNLPVNQNMFYGRQADVQTLLDSVLTTPGDSCALIGGRRMGKTSLLEMLISKLENSPRSSGFLILPIFLDFSGEEINSVGHFFNRISNQTVGLLQEKWNVGVEPLKVSDDQPPAPAFENLLPTWDREVLRKQGYPLRLVMIMDECEQIVEHGWSTSLYGSLRHLLVGRQTRMQMKIVMAGAHRFLSRVRQQGSPLRNILKYHSLHVLDPDSTIRLINEPTDNVIPENMAALIAQQSGGHPFLTQYLMYRLWETGLGNITEYAISRASNTFVQERGDFQDWLDGLGQSGYLLYSILAKTSFPMTEREIQDSLETYPPDFVQALDALCYHGIVVKEKEGYRTSGKMFYDWFIRHGVHWYENQRKVSQEDKSLSQIMQQTIIQGPYLDQRGQNVTGSQTTIGRDAHGELFSGQLHSHAFENDEIVGVFETILLKIEEMQNKQVQERAKNAVQCLAEEALKGDAADETRIRKWLNFLAETAPDVWEVAINTFMNPISGLNTLFQKIASRAKQGRANSDTAQ